MSSLRLLAVIAFCATVQGCGPAGLPRHETAPDRAAIVNAVADRYYAETLESDAGEIS